jgi:hypothetical protein
LKGCSALVDEFLVDSVGAEQPEKLMGGKNLGGDPGDVAEYPRQAEDQETQ